MNVGGQAIAEFNRCIKSTKYQKLDLFAQKLDNGLEFMSLNGMDIISQTLSSRRNMDKKLINVSNIIPVDNYEVIKLKN